MLRLTIESQTGVMWCPDTCWFLNSPNIYQHTSTTNPNVIPCKPTNLVHETGALFFTEPYCQLLDAQPMGKKGIG